MAASRQHQALTERGRFWQRHLQRWRQSGCSQAEYCRRHHLSAPAFGWWKRRLSAPRSPAEPAARNRIPATEKGSFVELTLGGREGAAVADGVVYEIALSRQRCLRLSSAFELSRVRQLLQLLEESC